MRQVQTIQTNIVTIYAFVDILKDHFSMSTLSLLSNETLNSRSTRREHSAPRQEDDEDSSNSDENDEDDENDKMRRISKKIEISPRTNRLSRRMSRRTTSSNRVKAKRKTKRSRSKAKIMRIKDVSHSIISLTIRSMRKKTLSLRRLSVRSSIRRRRNQSFRSILVEIRVCHFVCSKRVNIRSLMKTLIRLKKKNDRSRAKTTLTRRQNVVVASIFNRFV